MSESVCTAQREEERLLREGSFGELCDHIVGEHHSLLRAELPRIAELVAKVARRHGDTVPELNEIEVVFTGLHAELIDHIDREEEMLFPICRALDAEGSHGALGAAPRLEMHEAAHAEVIKSLEELRELGKGYAPETALCTKHLDLIESLDALERDLRQHIHEENDALFPRLRDAAGKEQGATAP